MRMPQPTLWAVPLAMAMGLAGCGLVSSDIFDVDVHLQTQPFSHDFGNAMGKVPPVPCSAMMNTCQLVKDALNDSRVAALCDGTMCYAQADVTLPSPDIDLSKEKEFQSKVAQKAVQAVRTIDLGYRVVVNTLSFDIPAIDVYVGPSGAMLKTDPGVLPIGTIGPIGKGQRTPDNVLSHLKVADGSKARDYLVGKVMMPKPPFVFLLAASPRLKAGDSLPAGNIEIDVLPTVTVGLPR